MRRLILNHLYAVALFKHDAPQHLVSGPFVNADDAEKAREAADLVDDRNSYVVVQTTSELEFEIDPYAEEK